MYTITFYSFKGGVGRTMALVNVAAELVRRGRKVLVVDFDLEAPGLETYQRLRPAKPHPGIVEYVTEFRRNFEVPDLRDYIYETKPLGKKGGRLWVMPAGRRDRAYRSALANLDWQRLYKDEAGFLLFEDTKKGWEEELKPDYVFIDSRTGDTDVLGICTRQLPDSVVLMFTPNEQNLEGLKHICADIRREETEGLKKKIKIHFVAANVPALDDERRILRRWLQKFEQKLQIPPTLPIRIIHRHESLRMMDQPVFVLQRRNSRLAREYRSLVGALQLENTKDPESTSLFWKQLQQQNSDLIDWNVGPYVLLRKILPRLVQQRRWEDAIRFLEDERLKESIAKERLASPFPIWKINRTFCLAIAHWGRNGEAPQQLCQQALDAYKPVLDEGPVAFEGEDVSIGLDGLPTCSCQELALLYWGAGKPQKAAEAIEKALEHIDDEDPDEHLFSSWTFQETTSTEFRGDCETMLRMIRGEPLRPAFLGPPAIESKMNRGNRRGRHGS